jgi:hypothetical protein
MNMQQLREAFAAWRDRRLIAKATEIADAAN